MKVQNPPLDPESVCQMHELWVTAFGNDFVSDVPDDVLFGDEDRWNCVDIYRHISEEQTISTAIVISPLALPSLGGLGEVLGRSPQPPGSGVRDWQQEYASSLWKIVKVLKVSRYFLAQ